MELDGVIATFHVVAKSDWATILPMTAMIGEVRNEHPLSERLLVNPIVRPEIPFSYMLIRTSRRPLSAQAQLFADSVEAEMSRNAAEWDTLVRAEDPARAAE